MSQLNRIGLYGGTFDPLHNAHMELAHWVVGALNLDELQFIPAARHPFKKNSAITQSEIRYQMLRNTLAGSEIFKVNRIEIENPGISYTIDTLKALRAYPEFCNAQLFLIIGEDNLEEFHLWKDPEQIFRLVQVIVLQRSSRDFAEINPRFRKKMILLKSPELNISSTMVRKRISAGKSVQHLIPEPVWTIIQKYQLYGFKKSENNSD